MHIQTHKDIPSVSQDVSADSDHSTLSEGEDSDTTDGSSQYDLYSEAVKSAPLKNRFSVLAESRCAPQPTRPRGSRIFTRTRVQPIPRNPVKVTTLQTNKDSDRVVHGHGPSIGLRAFQQTKSSLFHNRVCTGLFVTRLQPKTSVQNIQGHTLKETG